MPEKTERLGLICGPWIPCSSATGGPSPLGHRSESGLPAPQTFHGCLAFPPAAVRRRRFLPPSAVPHASGAALAEKYSCGRRPGWIAEISVRGPWLAELSGHGAPPSALAGGPGQSSSLGGEGAPFVQLSPRRQAMPGWDGACA
jgi:hypothetical protein